MESISVYSSSFTVTSFGGSGPVYGCCGPPEYLRNPRRYGPEQEIFSLLLLELLTGRDVVKEVDDEKEYLYEFCEDNQDTIVENHIDPKSGQWPGDLGNQFLALALRCTDVGQGEIFEIVIVHRFKNV